MRILRLLLMLATSGAAVAGWSVLVEPALTLVRHETVHPATWTAPPLRIAMLGDLHVGAPHVDAARVSALVKKVNAAQPDVVVLLGDYAINEVAGGHPVAVTTWAPLLSKLDAPLGTWGVLGNHDWWNDGDAIRRALADAGVHMLENEAAPLRFGDGHFWIAGLGDAMTRPVKLDRTLDPIPADDSVVLLSHSPRPFSTVPETVELTLAAHTHGGQVWLPLIGAPALRDESWQYGHYVRGPRHLWVTAGIGTSILPIRLGAPPEIVILDVSAPPPER